MASAPLRWMAAAHLPTKRCICASATLGAGGQAWPASLMAHSGSLMMSQARMALLSPAASTLRFVGDLLQDTMAI